MVERPADVGAPPERVADEGRPACAPREDEGASERDEDAQADDVS